MLGVCRVENHPVSHPNVPRTKRASNFFRGIPILVYFLWIHGDVFCQFHHLGVAFDSYRAHARGPQPCDFCSLHALRIRRLSLDCEVRRSIMPWLVQNLDPKHEVLLRFVGRWGRLWLGRVYRRAPCHRRAHAGSGRTDAASAGPAKERAEQLLAWVPRRG